MPCSGEGQNITQLPSQRLCQLMTVSLAVYGTAA
jgi:hypothetical protein